MRELSSLFKRTYVRARGHFASNVRAFRCRHQVPRGMKWLLRKHDKPRINHCFGRVIEREWGNDIGGCERKKRNALHGAERKTEIERHRNDLFPWSRGSCRRGTRNVPASAYRVFRKCKPGTTRLHSTAEASNGKSRGGFESIKRPVNKVTHFEIYECTPCDILSSLGREKGREKEGEEVSFCKLASSLNRLSPNGTIPRLRTRNFENLAVTRDVRGARAHTSRRFYTWCHFGRHSDLICNVYLRIHFPK